MISRRKFFLTIGLLWGVPIVAVFAAGAWFSHAGVVSVKVNEHRPGGDRVQVTVPGAMVHMALAVLPSEICAEAADEIGPYAPLIHSVVHELSRCPDGVFVEVDSEDEHVRIAKKRGHLTVEVESSDESVHVKVPLSMVTAFLSRVESAGSGRDYGIIRDGDRIRIDGRIHDRLRDEREPRAPINPGPARDVDA